MANQPFNPQKENRALNEALRQIMRKKNISDYDTHYKNTLNVQREYERKMIRNGYKFILEKETKALLAQLEQKVQCQKQKPWTYKDFILEGIDPNNTKLKHKILSEVERVCSEMLIKLAFQDVTAHASQNRMDIVAYQHGILFDFGCHGRPKNPFCTAQVFKDTLALCVQAMGAIKSAAIQEDVEEYYTSQGFINISLSTFVNTSSGYSKNILAGTVEKNDIQYKIKLSFDAEKFAEVYGCSVPRENSKKLKTYEIDNMDGHQFEVFCADILRKNNYENVTVTRGTGDQGVDIIAYRDGIKFGIQCKCYASDVGNKAIQEIFAGKTFYQCHIGVVLTNSYFTKSAIELAERNGIILWNRDMLVKLINTAK